MILGEIAHFEVVCVLLHLVDVVQGLIVLLALVLYLIVQQHFTEVIVNRLDLFQQLQEFLRSNFTYSLYASPSLVVLVIVLLHGGVEL